MPSQPDGGVRLQKLLSEAGIASRRAAENLITQGRVTVNGVRAKLGDRADLSRDKVEVDGERILTDPEKTYLVLNKPPGYITTLNDPEGRKTILDLVQTKKRVFPVGRLDAATTGLLILTNDGELSNRLAHPSYSVDKVYVAKVEGVPEARSLKRLTTGIKLDEGRPAKASKVRVLSTKGGETPTAMIELTVHEGRKHVVRNMFDHLGHPVISLVRVAAGPVRLGRLRPGEHRELTPKELAGLFKAVGL